MSDWDTYTDYWIASEFGGKKEGSLWSAIGQDEYKSRQRDWGLSSVPSGSCGGGIFDDALEAAGDFASDWTDAVVDWFDDMFAWVPSWFRLVLRFLGVACGFGMGVFYGLEGWWLLAVGGCGWFAPATFKWSLILSLRLTLFLVYLAFLCVVTALVLGALAAVLWCLAVLFV